MLLHVSKSLGTRLLIQLILDLIMLECLVSCGFQVIGERLQWRLQIVAVAHFRLCVLGHLSIVIDEEVGQVCVVLVENVR